MAAKWRHCDSFIDDPEAHPLLRAWLEFQRQPAISKMEDRRDGKHIPRLFADLDGKRVECTMASRFGDIGIRPVDCTEGPHVCYTDRGVAVEQLSNFDDKA